jgi:hypothetical protein
MLNEEDLIRIEDWERDHYGKNICEWKRQLGESEALENYDAFVLVVQEDGDTFNISVSVTFTDTEPGDLLSSKYQDECYTIEEAMVIAQKFVGAVEEKYSL